MFQEIVNANSIVQRNANQKWNNDKCQCECKKYFMCKKDDSWNPTIFICENNKDLKSIVDDSVIVRDEIINVTDSVSTNGSSAVSKISDNKNVRYKTSCYILHTFLLVTILLFIITIICYHYAKHRSK